MARCICSVIAALGLAPVLGHSSWTRGQEDQQTQSASHSTRQILNISSPELPVVLHAVRNLESENWVEDMEFEVENKSLRPIYYVSLTITFPDVPKTLGPNGRLWGLGTHAEYGRKDFAVNPGELATDDDLPIKPGERALIKLEALYSEGVKAFLKDHNFPEASIHRLIVRIEELRFGDGSGFRIGSVPYKWQTPQ